MAGFRHPMSFSGKTLFREEGFTLLEVLIAITILTVGLLGIAALTVGIIHANRQSTDLTSATTLAQSKLEDISRQYKNDETPVSATEDYGTIAFFPVCKRVTTIALIPPTTNMNRVTVEVFWHGDARSVKLETIVSR
ncbi:MAG: prepilin-type N-terminal cleavage/methylation domain-containing protein [Proteobacteria bacterium]|nr:prepilin-type N-terminal cleavage/methylation domain-containing protein [Pseudomonadota bacterium]